MKVNGRKIKVAVDGLKLTAGKIIVAVHSFINAVRSFINAVGNNYII